MAPTIVARNAGERASHLLCLTLSLLILTACATRPYEGSRVDSAPFLSRGITQQVGNLVVTAAVPNANETEQLAGLDLYEQGIQPVWLKVENRGDSRARIATWSVDRHYFSPIEVAYMNRKQFSSDGYQDMERWFYENGMPRFIPAGESRSGLVFTNLRQGTKGFNLVIFAGGTSHDFTFFVPLPGFVADFMQVDFANLYGKEQIRDFDLPSLKVALEQELPCCARDPTGELDGGPLNAVLVGSGMAVRRAMLRGSWLETSAAEGVAERARQQRLWGRQPDAIFTNIRDEGNERIQLHLWMTPWRVEEEPVWVGQVLYLSTDTSFMALFDENRLGDAGVLDFFVRESVMADVDSAQRYLLQNLWYNGSLKLAGFVDGVGLVPMDNPRHGFGGAAYFTEGWRLVAFLSEEPVALDETEIRFEMRHRRSEEEQ